MKLLKKGDVIGLAATARFIEPKELSQFIQWIESKNLRVKFAKNIYEKYHQFAGDDSFRLESFQELLNDDSLSAIWIVRGGYGTTRIFNRIDWSNFIKNPKWIIGFSDITLLHLQLASLGLPSIHGDMPSRFNKVSLKNFESILKILQDGFYEYEIPFNSPQNFQLSGKIIGGNLSLIAHSVGNPKIQWSEKYLLFLEDLEEYYYHVDRMAIQLQNYSIFDPHKCKGVLLGSFTDMKDNEIPFGFTAYEIFSEKTLNPILCGLPFGHDYLNLAFIHNHDINIQVNFDSLKIYQKYL